jgi:hypothetical protein
VASASISPPWPRSRHVPLARLLNVVLAAGPALERAEEAEGEDYPRVLALVARR